MNHRHPASRGRPPCTPPPGGCAACSGTCLRWEAAEVVCRRRPGGGAGDHVRPAHRPFRQLRQGCPARPGLPGNGKAVRQPADPLVPGGRRHGHRALGRSGRPRHRNATGLDTTVTVVHRHPRASCARCWRPAGPDGTRGVTSRPAGDRAQPSAARIPAASSPTCSSVITKAGEIWMPPAPTARVAIPCLRNVLASPSAAAGSAS